MTDPQHPFSAPQPPVAGPHPPSTPTGAPGYAPTPGYTAPAQAPSVAPTYPAYGYPVAAGPAPVAPQGAAKGTGIATAALIMAVAAFALEMLRYVGLWVAYSLSSDAQLPQPVSMGLDVVLFLLYAGAVVLALIGLPRRTGRLRSGIALGLGATGAAYLALQFVFSFIP